MNPIPYETILQEIREEVKPLRLMGNVASYIPELKKINPDKFGIHLRTLEGETYSLGDAEEKFSIQSISKVFTLACAVAFRGETLWERIGVEPSGNPFNSMVQLEYEKGIPRNPFINAGALVLADVLLTHLPDPKANLLGFIRSITDNSSIGYNPDVAASEKATGYLNASLVNLLRYYGNITNPVEEVLDLYYHQCSIEMSCRDLTRAFLPFANHDRPFSFGEVSLTPSQVKRINAVMLTCGFYDEAGEFSYRVGLPGKSGVGGGIVAFHPGIYTVAVWSPRLNKKGNSVIGMKALELLTTKAGISIF